MDTEASKHLLYQADHVKLGISIVHMLKVQNIQIQLIIHPMD
jgi:hypothetical protein